LFKTIRIFPVHRNKDGLNSIIIGIVELNDYCDDCGDKGQSERIIVECGESENF